MKPHNACRWLNNKAFFCDPPQSDKKRPEDYLTPFWCGKTHNPVGPDGAGVDLECCGPDRTCFRREADIEV